MQFVTANNHPQEDIDAAVAWYRANWNRLPRLNEREGDPLHVVRKEIIRPTRESKWSWGRAGTPVKIKIPEGVRWLLAHAQGESYRPARIMHLLAGSSCADLVRVEAVANGAPKAFRARLDEPYQYSCIREDKQRTMKPTKRGWAFIAGNSRARERRPLSDNKNPNLRIGPVRSEEQARGYLRNLRSYRNLRPGIYVPGARPQPLGQPMLAPGWWWGWRRWRAGESPEDKPFVDWKWRGRDGAFIVMGSQLYSSWPPSDPLLRLRPDAGIHRALRYIQCDGRATDVRYTRAAHVRYTRDTWGAGILLRMYYRQDGMHAETRNSQRKHSSAEAQLAPWMIAMISRKDYDGDWPANPYSAKRAQGWLLRAPSSHPPHYDLLRVETAELEPLAYTDRGFAGEVSRLLLLGYSPKEVAERLQWQAHKIRSFKVDWAEWLQIPAAEVKTALRRTKKRKLAVRITIIPPADAEGRCATVEFENGVE